MTKQQQHENAAEYVCRGCGLEIAWVNVLQYFHDGEWWHYKCLWAHIGEHHND